MSGLVGPGAGVGGPAVGGEVARVVACEGRLWAVGRRARLGRRQLGYGRLRAVGRKAQLGRRQLGRAALHLPSVLISSAFFPKGPGWSAANQPGPLCCNELVRRCGTDVRAYRLPLSDEGRVCRGWRGVPACGVYAE